MGEYDAGCEHMRLKYMASIVNDLHEENERLKAENARLREQVDAAHMSRLLTENENEKLRELMADMLRYYAMPNDIDYKREADLLERAHEMGVDA